MRVRTYIVGLIAVAGLLSWPFLFQNVFYAENKPDPGTLTAQPAGPVKPNPQALELQDSFVKIASEVTPAVVNISTIIEEKGGQQYEFFFGSPFEDFFGDFFGGDPRSRRGTPRQGPPSQHRLEGTGSGVIIDPNGYILTNEHVVRGAKEINVTLSNEKKYTGKVIGKDARTDIAVIKIKAGKDMPFAKLGDSDKMKVGQWAIAIGSPFGLEKTVTTGIVSAVRQSLFIEGKDYRDLIQTDAAINRGNSGGPLCNINGEVIGINTAIYAPTGVFSGIGFAIPINSAKDILDDLIHKGKVVRGWLGIEIRPVDAAIARQFGLPDTKGVLINDVIKGSPADKAGLKRGDVIRQVNGKPVDDVRALQTQITQMQPRTRVNLQIFRDGKAMTLALLTGEMPQETDTEETPEQQPQEENQTPDIPTADWQGIQVTTLTPEIAQQFEGIAKDEKGCIVIDIQPGSAAEDIGLMPGDVIRNVNGKPTPTVKDFQSQTRGISAANGFVLDIDRQGRLLYLSYEGKDGKDGK